MLLFNQCKNLLKIQKSWLTKGNDKQAVIIKVWFVDTRVFIHIDQLIYKNALLTYRIKYSLIV